MDKKNKNFEYMHKTISNIVSDIQSKFRDKKFNKIKSKF